MLSTRSKKIERITCFAWRGGKFARSDQVSYFLAIKALFLM